MALPTEIEIDKYLRKEFPNEWMTPRGPSEVKDKIMKHPEWGQKKLRNDVIKLLESGGVEFYNEMSARWKRDYLRRIGKTKDEAFTDALIRKAVRRGDMDPTKDSFSLSDQSEEYLQMAAAAGASLQETDKAKRAAAIDKIRKKRDWFKQYAAGSGGPSSFSMAPLNDYDTPEKLIIPKATRVPFLRLDERIQMLKNIKDMEKRIQERNKHNQGSIARAAKKASESGGGESKQGGRRTRRYRKSRRKRTRHIRKKTRKKKTRKNRKGGKKRKTRKRKIMVGCRKN